MKEINLAELLAPFAGENPAGEDLRYTQVHEAIKEAKRADDPLDRGDWRREIKKSDWEGTLNLCLDALTNKTKDLQIAVWTVEALVALKGFEGFSAGLEIVIGLLKEFWDSVYPQIEEGDTEFRGAPLEYLNEKLWLSLKQVPLTDTAVTPGYGRLKWEESRQVGYEADTKNRYGDVDDARKAARDEMIADGKLTAEDFDAAVALSSRAFYESLARMVSVCLDRFKELDETVDARFGADAPRLAELRTSLEECEQVVTRLLKEKKQAEPAPEVGAEEEASIPKAPEADFERIETRPAVQTQRTPAMTVSPGHEAAITDRDLQESVLWEEALRTMEASGMQAALGRLLAVSNGAPSVREKNRCRLLIARLCLKAGRPDLARPIVEELNALIEELHLERWESSSWIAEVLDALYQCLTGGEPTDDDLGRARVLYQRLCTTDVTRAIQYRSGKK